jgi:H/ACA ribonucleoprotein complex subunit 3
MRSMLRKCIKCETYTLKDTCSCGGEAKTPIPPRFSPDDRLGRYRRIMKQSHKEQNN